MLENIYTDIVGDGYPLVLVHGYFGSSNMWCHQKKIFSKKFKVIAPSLPGYGESYKLKSFDRIQDMANTVIKIIKKQNIDKFHLMGHSMGGMIVQEIVKLAPEIVNKLLLFGTGSIGDIPGRFEPIDVSRERLKKDGVKSTANRIAKTWFVDGDKAKNFYLCEEAYQNINQETGNSFWDRQNIHFSGKTEIPGSMGHTKKLRKIGHPDNIPVRNREKKPHLRNSGVCGN